MYWPQYWHHVNLDTIIAPRYERSYYSTSIVTNTLVWIVSDMFYITTPRYATGRWFSLGTPVSSTNNTDCHDVTVILLKMALNTIKQTNKRSLVWLVIDILYYSISLRTVVDMARYEYTVRCWGETVLPQTLDICRGYGWTISVLSVEKT